VAVQINHRVAVLDADPELGQELTADRLAAARAVAVAPVASLARGPWRPPTRTAAGGYLGLLVLDGLLTRTIRLLGRPSMQLLGAEDLLRPWDDDATIGSVPRAVAWTVHEPARVAVLDRGFAERVTPWPEIGAALIARALRHGSWLDAHSRSSRTRASSSARCSSSGTWPTAGGASARAASRSPCASRTRPSGAWCARSARRSRARSTSSPRAAR
jgi:hypothetical protein